MYTRHVYAYRIATLVSACCIAGCSNMSGIGGTAEFSCKVPGGVHCAAVTSNYYDSLRGDLPSQRQKPAADQQTSGNKDTAHTYTAKAGPVRHPSGARDGGNASGTLVHQPLRSQSRVIRLWYKPWEDADHDMWDQGYVYVVVDSGRWLVDHTQRRNRESYMRLRPPQNQAAVEQKQTNPTHSGQIADSERTTETDGHPGNPLNLHQQLSPR